MTDAAESQFSAEVGRRLRAVRRQRRWSLDDVERESGGRWSASAVGAYERGYRNLSLPRLHELAAFYRVSMSLLLGEVDSSSRVATGSRRIVLDLAALERSEPARAVARFTQVIRDQRNDHDAVVLSIRTDDVRALCSILDLGEAELADQLEEWGVLASSARTGEEVLDLVAAEAEETAEAQAAEVDGELIDLRADAELLTR